MKMRKLLSVVVSLLSLSFCLAEVKAQKDEVPKFELGAQFTSITKPESFNNATEIGFGGRFTFNLNRSVALEAVGNFFPRQCNFCGSGGGGADNSGNISQGFFGVKAGKRFEKWGLFAKARPGVVSFSKADSQYVSTGTGVFPFQFQQKRLTDFAADLGVVLEFYPTKHLVTRFEAGDTLIHYGSRQTNTLGFTAPDTYQLINFTTRAETRHNFQFVTGIGWRF